MSWGTELWDQFDNLDKHTQWGIDFLERYAKFVKERLDIEQNYAKQLRNLVKKYCPKRSKDEEPKFTSCVSFYSILNELNDYAGQREVVAEEMTHKVYGELMRYSQDLKAERKHHLQEGRKAQQYLDQCWKQMDNAKAQFYLRTHTADESKNEYAAQLQNFNGEQWKHFNNAIPHIFKNLQDMDERRTVKLGETYRSFAEVERRVIPIVSKCLDGMVSAAKAVNERKDSAIVVESFKSGFEPPGDFPFEDFSQNLSRTGSDGTISNTPKGDRDKEKDGGSAPRSDPKHAVSRSKNKLWLFGKKPKAPSLEDYSHLPPEQRRKRLQQRIDELNKELQKEMDQRDALNKMKDVYEKNPQMGDPSSLQPKISETICNMEKLRSEIHKNETWLSEVEGKQSSRGDRRHSADNHHHTPQGRESPEGSYTDDTSQEHHTPRQRPSPSKTGPQNPDPHEFDDEFDDDDPLPVIGHCKALYSFDGQNEGTLVIAEDEVLYIIEEDKGDGWTRARKQSGEEGYVPTSYVDITLEKNSKGS
uniref:Formin binding protein 1-like n=1 Tax=Cynoglossus semilaevis TaxID=244447 RepID=A0A3P8UPE0_CYNSE